MTEQLYQLAGKRTFEDDWGYDPNQPDAKAKGGFSAAKRVFLQAVGVGSVATATASLVVACGGGKPAAAPEVAAATAAPAPEVVKGPGNVLLTDEGKFAIEKAMYTSASLEIPGYYVPDRFPTAMAMEWNEKDGMFIGFEGSEYSSGSNQSKVRGLKIRPIPANEAEGNKRQSKVQPFAKEYPNLPLIIAGNDGRVKPTELTPLMFNGIKNGSNLLSDLTINEGNQVYLMDKAGCIMVVEGKDVDGNIREVLVLMDKKGGNLRAFNLTGLIDSAIRDKRNARFDLEFSIVGSTDDPNEVLYSNMLGISTMYERVEEMKQ